MIRLKKIIKNCSYFLLISIIFFNFSFCNIIHAEDSVSGNNAPEGVYYIQNVINSRYMEDVDCNLALTTRSPQDVQKWEFIYVSNGYYNIRNIATGMYLTAPNNGTSEAL